MKPWLYRFAGILVSAFFIYLAVRRVDVAESLRVLGSIEPWILLAGTLVYLCGLPIRALRWRLILRTQKALSLKEILVPLTVGHMANNVLPARTGELYRAHFLGRRVRMSRSGVVGSIVVERTLDGLMMVAVILLVFLLFPGERFLGGAALVTGIIFVAVAAVLLFHVLAPESTRRVEDRIVGFLPDSFREPVGARLGAFSHGARGVSTAREIFAAAGYTALIWAVEAAAAALVVISFGITLPIGGYLLVFALAALSTTLPSGPGYVGPYQYAFVLSLGYFSVSRETALAVSVAAQAALLGSVVVIGLALLWSFQLRGDATPEERVPQEPEREKVGRG